MMQSPEVKNFLHSQTNKLTPMVPRQGDAWHVPSLGTQQSGFAYQIGTKLPDMAGGRPVLKPVGNYINRLGDNHMASALAGAGVGALAGAGIGLMRGGNPMNGAMVGAGVGAGGSALLSLIMRNVEQNRELKRRRYHGKSAAFYGTPGNDMGFIQSRLFSDSNIPSGQRSELLESVSRLNPDQVSRLAGLIRGAAGASVGYIVARFLGLGTGTLGAIAGGVVGMMSGRSPRNTHGQSVNTEYDVFNRRRLLY